MQIELSDKAMREIVKQLAVAISNIEFRLELDMVPEALLAELQNDLDYMKKLKRRIDDARRGRENADVV